MIFYYSFQVHEQVEERGEVCFEESKVCLFFIGEGEKKDASMVQFLVVKYANFIFT